MNGITEIEEIEWALDFKTSLKILFRTMTWLRKQQYEINLFDYILNSLFSFSQLFVYVFSCLSTFSQLFIYSYLFTFLAVYLLLVSCLSMFSAVYLLLVSCLFTLRNVNKHWRYLAETNVSLKFVSRTTTK